MKKLFSVFLSLALVFGSFSFGIASPAHAATATPAELLEELSTYAQNGSDITKSEAKIQLRGRVRTNEVNARGSFRMNATGDMEAEQLSAKIDLAVAGKFLQEKMAVKAKGELRAIGAETFGILQSFNYTGDDELVNIFAAQYLEKWIKIPDTNNDELWSPTTVNKPVDILEILGGLADELSSEGISAELAEAVKTGAIFTIKKSEPKNNIVKYTLSMNRKNILDALDGGTIEEMNEIKKLSRSIRLKVRVTVDTAKETVQKVEFRVNVRKIGELKSLMLSGRISGKEIDSVNVEAPTEYTTLEELTGEQ